MHCARYIVRLLEAASAPSHPGAVTTLGPSPPSPCTSSLQSLILSVLPRSLVVFQACIAAFRLAMTTRSFTCPGYFPAYILDFYFPLYDVLGLMMELWPDQRCHPAMLRVLARSAVAGAHAYMTLALLLDWAPNHGSEPRSLSGIPRTPELEDNISRMVTRVCHVWILLLTPADRDDQLLGIRSNDQCGVANDMQNELHQPPSAQQLAPLALDLVWGMEGMLQLLCITSPGLKGSLEHKRTEGCRALADSHKFLLPGQQQAPPGMSPEAERLLACLTLVLTVALPLDTWLAVAPSLPAAEVKVMEQASAIHDSLTRVEPEQVWSWQALAAGTPAEASLASVLQGAANKLQLTHLVAPAPLGWQPGRLTLDRGRGPPELMRLCFPAV
ncbi:hypothetical protein QJQ45_008613 [Haematococcus lacustris]|nr:hypothetical protein QJQ45_008613 [Haematococcus lacustris]